MPMPCGNAPSTPVPRPSCPSPTCSGVTATASSAIRSACAGLSARPSRRTDRKGVALDDLQEGGTIALELGVADAMDLAHGAGAGGPMGGELDQGTIGEHDV